MDERTRAKVAEPITETTKYLLSEDIVEDLESRFSYHAPKEDQPQRYVEIRQSIFKSAVAICLRVPHGRERAMALTKLEEATMWANAGIARNE